MKSDLFGPIGIHKPRRYQPANGYTPTDAFTKVVDEEMENPVDPFKPGKRKEEKVTRYVIPPGMLGPGTPTEMVRGKNEPGFSIGPFGINIGTKDGRRRQLSNFSDAMTPEISEIMSENGVDKAVSFVTLTPKLLRYAAAETVAVNAAHLALPGLGMPVLLPVIAGTRAYRKIYQTRTDFEFHVKSGQENNTFRNRMIIAGTDVAMLPFDITASVAGHGLAFGLNFLAGKTFINKIPGSLAKLDPKLEGLKPVDDGMTNIILDSVDKVSNLLTFSQPAANAPENKKVA